MQRSRARFLISGMVQGVFFRAFTRDVASRIGLKGWVKNLPDGRVEAIFEGEREDIEQARIHCLSGPPGSRVDAIDVQWEEYQGDMKDFQVRHY